MSGPGAARDGLAAVQAKLDHQARAVAALEALRVQLGLDEDRAGLIGWLKQGRVKPLVDVRCLMGHKLAGVYRASTGAIFVAWPEISSQHEARTGLLTVTGDGDQRRRPRVLFIEPSPHDQDDDLEVSCPCAGVRPLAPGTRLQLSEHYAQALRGRPRRITVEENLTAGLGRRALDERKARRAAAKQARDQHGGRG